MGIKNTPKKGDFPCDVCRLDKRSFIFVVHNQQRFVCVVFYCPRDLIDWCAKKVLIRFVISPIFDWLKFSHVLKSWLTFWLFSWSLRVSLTQRCDLITVIYVSFVQYNYVCMFMYIAMTHPRIFFVVCLLLLKLLWCDFFLSYMLYSCNNLMNVAAKISD